MLIGVAIELQVSGVGFVLRVDGGLQGDEVVLELGLVREGAPCIQRLNRNRAGQNGHAGGFQGQAFRWHHLAFESDPLSGVDRQGGIPDREVLCLALSLDPHQFPAWIVITNVQIPRVTISLGRMFLAGDMEINDRR